MKYVLWTLQVVLALLFLFAGVMKFVPMPPDAPPMPVSIQLLRFIGVAEILGGLGLVLPGLLRIRPGLTPLAASGLVIIMIGATVITLRTMGPLLALLPLIVCLLLIFVAYGRAKLVPLRGR